MKSQSVAVEPVCIHLSPPYQIDPSKVYSSIVDVVFAIDGQGFFRFVSPSCLELFGYTQAEMTGASFLNFIYPDDIEKTVQIVAERTPDCRTSNFENRYVRKDGTLVPIVWSGRWDDNDKLLYCVARDGSEKKEIEYRLHRAQQLAKVANYEFDLQENRYTYTSDTLFELFGIDRKKHPVFTIDLFWSHVYPDDIGILKANLQLPDHLYSPSLEYRIVRPDGEIVYIHRIPEVIRDSSGRHLKTIGTLQDITDHKISELALKQNEEKFRSLVQNGNDLLGIIDLQGNYLFVGENVREHLGLEAFELIGKNAFTYIHPDDTGRVGTSLQEISTKHKMTVGPFRFRNSKGEWRWVETTVANHLKNPAIGGLVLNSRDVTEKKQKEEERQKIQERFSEQNQIMVEVLEQMRDGFISITIKGNVIYWNAAAETLTGRNRDEVLGKSIWNLFPGVERTPFFQVYKRLLSSSRPIQETIFSPLTKRWVELRAYRTKKGISVFFHDVTKRVLAEEELRKLSLIAKETNNPVILQDKERIVLWVNNAFTSLTGYTVEECVGRPIGEICDGPETGEKVVQYVQEKILRKEPFRVESLNYKKNGETYWSDVSCQPLFDDNGEVLQYFSIATDITERKRLEKQLQKEQRERQIEVASATLKAQERERSVVSQELHDNVNQVLTTVKLYTEMCRDGIGNPNEIMGKSLKLLQDSINEIRSLSKRLSAPSLGKIKLAESVKELVEAVVATNKFEVYLDTSGIDQLQTDQEIHLAVYRILQEHLTNILKYAEASQVEIKLDF
jgi:PAS domain S-box-containing protein